MNELLHADRFCDTPSDSPYWNESVWFSFSIPERRIHGSIQYYFRPNMGMLNGGPIMWDPSGTYQWDCLYYNWSHLQGMPPDAKKFDVTANNSLSMKVLEPLNRYAIGYDNEDFEMALEWQAIGPIHELRTGDPGAQAVAKFHIEQPGRIKGIVRRDGEEFAVDAFSMRDVSYGERQYGSLASGGYFWGIAENSAFHAIAVGEGREQKVLGGFIWRDGELGSLVSGTRRVTKYGRLGPKEVLFEATDNLGRTVTATGNVDEGLIHTGYTDHTVVWSLTDWDWDGVHHLGDNQEFCSAVKFRRIARGEIEPGS